MVTERVCGYCTVRPWA